LWGLESWIASLIAVLPQIEQQPSNRAAALFRARLHPQKYVTAFPALASNVAPATGATGPAKGSGVRSLGTLNFFPYNR